MEAQPDSGDTACPAHSKAFAKGPIQDAEVEVHDTNGDICCRLCSGYKEGLDLFG